MDYDYDTYDEDLSDDNDVYYFGHDNEAVGDDYSIMTLEDVLNLCLIPTIYDTVKSTCHVLAWCFLFRVSTQTFPLSSNLQHTLCLLSGLISLHAFFSSTMHYILLLALSSYLVLFLTTYLQVLTQRRGLLLILLCLSFIVICELWLVDPKQWHRIRGSQIVVIMKAVSLGFDLDIGTVKDIPSLLTFSGYMLCPGTCIFGPWTSFNEYLTIYQQPRWNFKWLRRVALSLLLSLVFLSVSTCWSFYLIPDDTWKWFLAYRDALSFRFSHYFVSYLSQATMLLSGFTGEDLAVTKPAHIELPRSLIDVVVCWNIPMHHWLKVFVFNTGRRMGNFLAVLATYAVSALLHGVNFQLGAVLLSLGVYSYVEYMLRKKLASVFSACILARRCRTECSHKHRSRDPIVLATNLALSLVTVLHLAYLGVMFDSVAESAEEGYSYSHTLDKWSRLNYLSHYVAFITYVMYFFI